MSKNKNDGQPATAEDVEKGRAIFHVPDYRSKVWNLGFALPAEAVAANDIEVGEGEKIWAGTLLTVIQAEIVDDKDVLLGFLYANGQGVCEMSEVTFK